MIDFVLVVMLVGKLGEPPRYQFHGDRTAFEITRFLTRASCEQAGKDLIEPMSRAGFMIASRCEERELRDAAAKIREAFP